VNRPVVDAKVLILRLEVKFALHTGTAIPCEDCSTALTTKKDLVVTSMGGAAIVCYPCKERRSEALKKLRRRGLA
jgi:hypothetical protein